VKRRASHNEMLSKADDGGIEDKRQVTAVRKQVNIAGKQ
jgi:hypothetical protein